MKKIKFSTAGESHGELLLGILEGIPANLDINESYIHKQLKRRQMGFGRGKRMQIESDTPEIYSGVRLGKTLGSPIGIIIKNNDWKNWKHKMSVAESTIDIKKITLPRPGHADLAGILKYGFDDIRNVIERSSARETAMRVALGSICRKLLEKFNIQIGSYVTAIYNVKDQNNYMDLTPQEINTKADKSMVRSLNKSSEKKMIDIIKDAKEEGDSVGGSFQIHISGVPYGLGSYTSWDEKLNARLGNAILSINGIKSFDIGLGSLSEEKKGSQLHDEIFYDKTFKRGSNNCGGIEGGISNGQKIIISATMKPIPTLIKPLQSVDINTKESKLAHKERTDSCSVPAASIIGESMACMVICDALLDKFGGDSIEELTTHIHNSAKY
tara:strand:- start:404 stop:1555 length:1152 start_codon:yes stop_codon:yes gene_type:complete